MATLRTATHGADGGPIFGRERELARLERLVDGLPERGSALLVRGEAGIGKSTLLAAASRRAEAAGMRVLRASGVQSEARLPFAGLHQLVMPVLGHAEQSARAAAHRAPGRLRHGRGGGHRSIPRRARPARVALRRRRAGAAAGRRRGRALAGSFHRRRSRPLSPGASSTSRSSCSRRAARARRAP